VIFFFVYIYVVIPFINCIESKVLEYVKITKKDEEIDIFQRIKIDDKYSIDLDFGELVDNEKFDVVPRTSIPKYLFKTETTLNVVDGHKYELENRLSNRNKCATQAEYDEYITFCEGMSKVKKVIIGNELFLLIKDLDVNNPSD
jgi:hypothetical protein